MALKIHDEMDFVDEIMYGKIHKAPLIRSFTTSVVVKLVFFNPKVIVSALLKAMSTMLKKPIKLKPFMFLVQRVEN